MSATTDRLQSALERFADEVAAKYTTATGDSAWPEEQLKSPVEALVRSAGHALGYEVVVQTETPQSREPGKASIGRVDMAVSAGLKGQPIFLTGHIELKAPGKGADPRRFKLKHDKDQWGRFKALPNLVYTDGSNWTLWRTGDSALPEVVISKDIFKHGSAAVTRTDAENLEKLLSAMFSWGPIAPRTSRQLAELLAPLCHLLRMQALESLKSKDSALSALAKQWKRYLFPSATDDIVADAYAQTFTYALLIARFDGADPLTIENARRTLSTNHSLLGEVLGLLSNPSAFEELKLSAETLLRVIGRIDPNRITKKNNSNPWLYFYEEFLQAYDPKLRKKVGAYYTPPEVVHAQVAIVDSLLKSSFGKTRGFADACVTSLDPAVGTGTYPLGILESVVADTPKNAPAAAAERLRQTVNNLYGFEYLIGPYSVAHLRLSQFLASPDHPVYSADGSDLLKILLADTLAPFDDSADIAIPGVEDMFGYQAVYQEREEARRLKKETRVFVCIGNPPYLRGKKTDMNTGQSVGGWVTMAREPIRGSKIRSKVTGRLVKDIGDPGIISDFIDPVVKAGRGRDLKNLYNTYVYFWRWAMWKVLEQNSSGTTSSPIQASSSSDGGIVSFITASSFLRGPGFLGMREHMRRQFDDIYIIDLGGDNKGGRKTENVFSIETPVAITTGVRYANPQLDRPATVHYVDLSDLSARDKLLTLDSITGISDDSLSWRVCLAEWQDPFLPAENETYLSWPALTDLLPWQTGGSQVKRTWPISPDRETLLDRWNKLTSPLDPMEVTGDPHIDSRALRERRAEQLKESRDLTIDSKGVDFFTSRTLASIANERSGTPPQIRRYNYRSFDRQWVIADPRVGDYMKPATWKSHGDGQVYFTGMLTGVMGRGPTLVAAGDPPDLDTFRGSFGGRHVIPLWKNVEATQANVTPGVLEELSKQFGRVVPAEELFSYIYGVCGSEDYAARFWEELTIPGPRIPITKNVDLFTDVARVGADLIYFHTYGERRLNGCRLVESDLYGSAVYSKPVPANRYPEDFSYDAKTETLKVGDGVFTDVPLEVWEYEVSGLRVVRSWLGYRMATPAGKRSGSKLDAILPAVWPDLEGDELLKLLGVLEHSIGRTAEAGRLLGLVLEDEVFVASDVPMPSSIDRLPLVDVEDDDHEEED